tara:strand:+ start:372 stop:3020 length:2649 start_codon:yes stop_codon:yes gene_type:complete
MDKITWRLIEDIFNQAIKLPKAQQSAYITQACGTDTELFHKVKSLLDNQNNATKIYDVISKTAANFFTLQESLIGQNIGNYRVIKSLAKGGMGSVFLAERADQQYQQQVAIKLINTQLADKQTQNAFRTERQILANLQHANISRLLDGGTLDNNMPYLVMEYVKGEPINSYCHNNNLSLKARLTLFKKVCHVVQYAHQNLIIHCDLKPSNILITATGEVKLLDFGISKLIVQQSSGDNEENPLPTHAYSLAYSSPEQIRCEPVSIMADIYALGVVLFEMLTQQRPFDLNNKNLTESKNLLMNVEPLLASVALKAASTADSTNKITASQLCGDIDAIINKALEKSATLRYQSASQFADDINNFLNCQLVTARVSPQSLKLVKLFKRNKTISLTSLLLFSAIVSFSTTLWLQSIQLTKERDRSALTLSFFTDMFNELDPNKEKGQNVLVREVLDKTSTALNNTEHSLKQHPDSEAIIRSVIGNIYLELGMLLPAEQHLHGAMSLFQQQALTHSPAYLNLLIQLTRLYAVQFEHKKSLTIIYQSLALSKELYGDNAPHTLGIMSNLAGYLNMQGDHHAAKTLFEEVYLERLKTLGEEHIDTIATLKNIGIVYHWLGEYDKANEYYRNAYHLLVKTKGEKHPASFSILSLIGSVLQTMGQYQQALPIIKQHIEIATVVLGENHHEVLRSMHNLADVYKGLGQLTPAETLFRKVLKKRQEHLGSTHIETLQTQKKLAKLLNKIGGASKLEEALALALSTVNTNTNKLGEAHPDTLSSLQTLANVYLSQQQHDKARKLYLKILAIRDNSNEYQNHPSSITIYLNLASIDINNNKITSAEKMFKQAILIAEKHPKLHQQDIKQSALKFIEYYRSQNNETKVQDFQIHLI